MKKIVISLSLGMLAFGAFAQLEKKKEYVIKRVIIENGKERVEEGKFKDETEANKFLKQIGDSIQINVDAIDGKRRMMRIQIDKDGRMGDTFGDEKDVFIFRGDKNMPPMPGAPGRLGRPSIRMIPFEGGMGQEFRMRRGKLHERMEKQKPSTIQGLEVRQNLPFNGKLNVRFHTKEKGPVQIAVSDVNGKELATENIKDFTGEYLGQIDLKKSIAGVYFVRVSQNNDGQVRRIKVE